jgi:hypothetical protein
MRKPSIRFCLASTLIVLGPTSYSMSASEYVKKFKDCAIEQMLVYNIPASVTLAQGILESECGGSPLAVHANNHFGIKCHADWNGPYYVYNDDLPGEHFRKYINVNDSYKDHAEFLKSRPWYGFLFNYPRTDYRDWAFGLSKAGYATASDYAVRLVSIIQQNHLYDYDTVLQKLKGYAVLEGILNNKEKQNTVDFVVIKPGDCIYKIAREYNVDVDIICHYNGLNIKEALVPGQKLYFKERNEKSPQSGDGKRPASANGLSVIPMKSGSSKG